MNLYYLSLQLQCTMTVSKTLHLRNVHVRGQEIAINRKEIAEKCAAREFDTEDDQPLITSVGWWCSASTGREIGK